MPVFRVREATRVSHPRGDGNLSRRNTLNKQEGMEVAYQAASTSGLAINRNHNK